MRGRLAALVTAAALLLAPGATAGALPGGPGDGQSLYLATDYAGKVRQYSLYLPARVPEQTPAPLLLVLHGLFLDPATAEATSGMDRVADSGRVTVAYPQGLDGGWNAGTCCDASSRANVDDVGFLVHLVDVIDQIQPVDRDRVYLAGFSNGGMMALRAVCARPDVFAAAASVGGTLQSGCLSRAPSTALLLHGQRDRTVPYAGERYSRFLRTTLTPVPTAAATLARHAGCTGSTDQRSALLVRRGWTGCRGGTAVDLVTVPTLGHRWPTLEQDGVDGGRLVWDFLSAHRR